MNRRLKDERRSENWTSSNRELIERKKKWNKRKNQTKRNFNQKWVENMFVQSEKKKMKIGTVEKRWNKKSEVS